MPDLFNDKKEKAGEPVDIISLLKEYAATRIELGKLTLLERSTVVAANLITDGFVLFMLFLVFIFGSIALGFFLGEKLGSNAGGFGIITLIYLVLAVVMHVIKDKYIEKHLIDFMIKRITYRKKNGTIV